MLAEKVKEALKKNWGEKADALDCYAEVKLIYPNYSGYKFYLYAMDPEEKEVMCLMSYSNKRMDIVRYRLDEIYNTYNTDGEYPIIDEEYRKTRVSELMRRYI